MEKEVFIPKLNQSVKFVIGRSAAENFEIIDDAEPHHLWFHVANLPSCHVIAKVEEQWKKKRFSASYQASMCIMQISLKICICG